MRRRADGEWLDTNGGFGGTNERYEVRYTMREGHRRLEPRKCGKRDDWWRNDGTALADTLALHWWGRGIVRCTAVAVPRGMMRRIDAISGRSMASHHMAGMRKRGLLPGQHEPQAKEHTKQTLRGG